MHDGFSPRIALQQARRTAKPLDEHAWRAVIDAFTRDAFTDAQMAAWLMARVMHGISETEAVALTEAMLRSGETVTHEPTDMPIVDKHSTGGVGDATTLIVAPLLACVGVRVAKLSGGSLGHTGGTLDKLAAIPGMRTDLTLHAFRQQIATIGVALAAPTTELAPADRRLYALRDHVELVDDTALIAASIMSKKLAAGATHLVLDVKLGQASLLADDQLTRQLAQQCIAIGKAHGQQVTAILSDMNQPLGPAVGNALEVRAAVDVLAGHTHGRLGELSVVLATELLHSTGIEQQAANAAVRTALESGAALHRFAALVSAQGGDPRVIEDPTAVLGLTAPASVWKPAADGFVVAIDTRRLGTLARELAGAERDLTAGIAGEIAVGMGAGDVTLDLHTADPSRIESACTVLNDAVRIGDTAPATLPLVQEIIR